MPLPTLANVTRPQGHGYGALLEWSDTESLYLRLAAGPGRQMSIESAPAPDARVSTDENPEDMRPESGRAFSRSDWSGGEGLDRAHRRDGTDRDFTRYWDSSGIDVSPTTPGEPARARLLPETELFEAGDYPAVAQIDGVLFAADGDFVSSTLDPLADSPVWATENPHPSTTSAVLDLATLGSEVYAAVGDSLNQRDSAGSWSAWSDLEAVRCWSVKGRILGSTGPALYEAASGAGSTLLYTLPADREWTDVLDAGEAILASATDGYVYSFTINDSSALVLVGQTRFPNEHVTCLGGALGVVLVGTSQTAASGVTGRLWRFAIANGLLTEGQLLRTWTDIAPERALATRDSVYVQLDGGLWRYQLSTAGLSRHVTFDSGDPAGLAVIADKIIASVASSGLWRETDLYVSEGWLIGPAADFYTSARKQWVGARLKTPADLAGEVLLEYSTELDALTDVAHSSWRLATKATTSSPGDDIEQILRGVSSRFLIFKLTLRATANQEQTPVANSVAFRALPEPEEIVVTLPINVSDQLEARYRKRLHVQGVGALMWGRLKDIEGEDVKLTVFRPDEQIVGQVVAVGSPVSEITSRGSVTVYSLLTIRGKRIAPAAATSGNVWGAFQWGSAKFGGITSG